MTRGDFLRSLWSEGRVRVPVVTAAPHEGLAPLDEREDLARALLDCSAADRRELSGDPPALELEAAAWAAEMLYRGCSAVVHRDLGEPALHALFAPPCPAAASPGTCYSVDLSLRFLPDVIRIARAASGNDPLLPHLLKLAADWPLSSVGALGVDAGDVAPFWSDACLRALYVDRILDRQDASRLADPRVQDEVRVALGAHSELAPAIAAALASRDA